MCQTLGDVDHTAWTSFTQLSCLPGPVFPSSVDQLCPSMLKHALGAAVGKPLGRGVGMFLDRCVSNLRREKIKQGRGLRGAAGMTITCSVCYTGGWVSP